jgi:hypothetical protein
MPPHKSWRVLSSSALPHPGGLNLKAICDGILLYTIVKQRQYAQEASCHARIWHPPGRDAGLKSNEFLIGGVPPMIVRTQDSAELVLVPQTDHSKLVGQIAAQWGNDEFASAKPFLSVARAATCHDFGWTRYETDPMFNAVTGETLHYLDVPNSSTQLQSFKEAAGWLAEVDPYAALLVNMHRTGLWRRRYNVIEHPKAYLHPIGKPSMPLNEEIEAFIVKNEADQKEQRRDLDEAEVWTNYRLLQVWDLLGLYFSCHDPDELYITPVPQAYNASPTDGIRLTVKPIGRYEVKFEPFPFRKRGTKIALAVKRLPKRKFPSAEAFKMAYFQAQFEFLTFTLV